SRPTTVDDALPVRLADAPDAHGQNAGTDTASGRTIAETDESANGAVALPSDAAATATDGTRPANVQHTDPALASVGRYLGAFVVASGLGNGATIGMDDAGVRVALNGTFGFASGSAELRPGAAPLL